MYSVRGSVGSFLNIAMNFGILFSFITGPYLPYNVLPLILITFPILFTIGVTFLPNVPSYLLKSGKIQVK